MKMKQSQPTLDAAQIIDVLYLVKMQLLLHKMPGHERILCENYHRMLCSNELLSVFIFNCIETVANAIASQSCSVQAKIDMKSTIHFPNHLAVGQNLIKNSTANELLNDS